MSAYLFEYFAVWPSVPFLNRISFVLGDVDEALALVRASDGISRAKDVAVVQAEKAMDAVLTLEQSPARDALVQLAHKIVNRNHWCHWGTQASFYLMNDDEDGDDIVNTFSGWDL